MKTVFTYGKQEKLKSRKQIEMLFKTGKHFYRPPIKIFYRMYENKHETFSLKAGMGVSKKYFSKAAKRNRIKRLLREAFRLHKNTLQQTTKSKKLCLDLFFLYTSREIISANESAQKMVEALNALTKKINQA